MPSLTSVRYSLAWPSTKIRPRMNVKVNQRRSANTSPRSAANTPIWQVTDEETRISVTALPPFTGVSLVSQGRLDPFLALVLLLSAALYLYGVYRLRLRGDRWPVGRTLLFLVPGLGSVVLVTMSGVGTYDDTLLSAHM